MFESPLATGKTADMDDFGQTIWAKVTAMIARRDQQKAAYAEETTTFDAGRLLSLRVAVLQPG